MREFGYSKGNLYASVIAFAGISAYIHWKHPDAIVWALPFVAIIASFHFIYPMAKVVLDEERIRISYLYPFRKNLEIEHHEVESYNPVKMKKGKKDILIMGFVTPRGGKAHMLWSSGTRDFEELSAILEGSYPRKDYTADPSNRGNVG